MAVRKYTEVDALAKYIESAQLEELLEKAGEVGRLINGLSNSIEHKLASAG